MLRANHAFGSDDNKALGAVPGDGDGDGDWVWGDENETKNKRSDGCGFQRLPDSYLDLNNRKRIPLERKKNFETFLESLKTLSRKESRIVRDVIMVNERERERAEDEDEDEDWQRRMMMRMRMSSSEVERRLEQDPY
jgi:hypothetical protein